METVLIQPDIINLAISILALFIGVVSLLLGFMVVKSKALVYRFILISGLAFIFAIVFITQALDGVFLTTDYDRVFIMLILASMLLVILIVFWFAYTVIRHHVLRPLETLQLELDTNTVRLEEQNLDLANKEAQIQRLKLELIEANHYKVQFLSNMSHELRTPLNSVIGYSELLISPIYGELNEQQEDRLIRISRNGKHLLELIESLLDISKLSSDNLEIEINAFDVQDLLTDLFIRIQPKIDEKSLVFKQNIQSDLPSLPADRKRIEQILYSLLDNAIKFTHTGTISMTVMNLYIENGISQDFVLPMAGWMTDGKWMLFQVEDTGIGIIEEDLSNIFIDFVQLDGSAEREFGGIGIGLSIVQQLVEKHAGMIWVRSKLEVGSTFFVALPIDLK